MKREETNFCLVDKICIGGDRTMNSFRVFDLSRYSSLAVSCRCTADSREVPDLRKRGIVVKINRVWRYGARFGVTEQDAPVSMPIENASSVAEW